MGFVEITEFIWDGPPTRRLVNPKQITWARLDHIAYGDAPPVGHRGDWMLALGYTNRGLYNEFYFTDERTAVAQLAKIEDALTPDHWLIDPPWSSGPPQRTPATGVLFDPPDPSPEQAVRTLRQVGWFTIHDQVITTALGHSDFHNGAVCDCSPLWARA